MEYADYDLIYLEPDVQLNMLVEKIRKSPSKTLAFVVHNRSAFFYSTINLELIRKRLLEEEKEAVFITSNPQLKTILQQEDWTVFPHREYLQEDILPKGVLEFSMEENPLKKPTRRKKARGMFFLLLLLLVGLLVYYYVNSTAVVIQITPSRRVHNQQLIFAGDFQSATPSLEKSSLPLKSMPFHEEEKGRFPATGKKLIGISKAHGQVRFINEEVETVFVAAGTPLYSLGGIPFITNEDVRVPGVELDYLLDVVIGRKAGWAEVNIQAQEKGSAGNIGAGQIREWGARDNVLLVINPREITGGEDRSITVVTEQDIQKGKAKVEEILLQKLKGGVEEVIGDEYLVVRDHDLQGFLTLKTDKRVGEEATYFSITGQIEGEIIYLHKEELEYLVAKSFVNDLSPGFRPAENPLQIKNVYMEGSRDVGYSIHLSIAGEVVADINTKDLENNFKGVSLDTAQNTLRTMPEVEGFHIMGHGRDRFPSYALGVRVIVED